ncbi:unnamed protein product, partial [Ectocarpus sp. 12 AP-2014]
SAISSALSGGRSAGGIDDRDGGGCGCGGGGGGGLGQAYEHGSLGLEAPLVGGHGSSWISELILCTSTRRLTTDRHESEEAMKVEVTNQHVKRMMMLVLQLWCR